jgi:hypothetical protein
MAGDWIKMRTNLDSDPRVLELAHLLGREELHVIGMLWKVWAWADSHTLDGNAIRVTCVTLDRFAACSGFADALRKVGWLDGRDNAITFPRFAEHNGQTAKKRAETKERVAKHRNAKRVTDVTLGALPEKRREEKRRLNNKQPGGHLQNEEFAKAFRAFVASSINNHSWPCDEISQEAWLYDLQGHPVEEATAMLWYSVRRGVKVPITNGDHKRELMTGPVGAVMVGAGAGAGGGARYRGRVRKSDEELFGD